MTERVGVTRTVDLEVIYADRPDILSRLQQAQELYKQYYTGELTLEQVSEIIWETLITDPENDELLTIDVRLRGVNPLNALRNNLRLGHSLSQPTNPQETPQDSDKAA